MAAPIEQYPDGEQRRRIMDFIMAAGQALLENGAEVFRVEQTMQIMARSFHLREFNVYVLTNGIFASAGTAEISEVRNVPNRTIHLGRVDQVNELSREIAAGQVTLDEAEQRLAEARRIPFPRWQAQLLAGTAGAFAFSLMFGGNLASGAAAAVAGFVVSAYLLACQKYQVPSLELRTDPSEPSESPYWKKSSRCRQRSFRACSRHAAEPQRTPGDSV